MKLMTKKVKKLIPPLYSQENKGEEALAVVKYFTPDSSWTWYVMEGEEKENGDYLFFGLVDGPDKEYGYFTLNELLSIRGHLGLPVERDLYFSPTKTIEFE